MITLRTRVGRKLFASLGPGSERNLRDTLASETVGGALLLAATVIAIAWANSPWKASYFALVTTVVGPSWLGDVHLSLTVGQWAADGLLAIFFFVVGLELKREFVDGELRRPATAIIPIVAAVGGMIVPALIYVGVNVLGSGDVGGWAVPTATDIAFAVAVLAVVSTHLPNALRAFLLTLAVVDDLLAITIIAVFYTDHVNLGFLAAALGVIAVFGVLVQRRITSGWVLVPLGVLAWALMHASGIHATIAGVLLGFVVPATVTAADKGEVSIAERFEHRWRPVSASFAVPVFAVLSAGVTLSGAMVADAIRDPAAQGVAAGLVLGKPVGILVATFLVATFTKASLDDGLSWWDVVGIAALGGIGFTVSLLIGDLAFGTGSAHDEHVKVAILAVSVTAAIIGGSILAWRNRQYRRSRLGTVGESSGT